MTGAVDPAIEAEVSSYAQEATRLLAGDAPVKIDGTPLGQELQAEFAKAEVDRYETEKRWLTDLRQYRGRYEPEAEAKMSKNRSRSFVRKTRVKVKTTTSRMMDLLFPAGRKRPFSVEATPDPYVPENVRRGFEAKAFEVAATAAIQAAAAQLPPEQVQQLAAMPPMAQVRALGLRVSPDPDVVHSMISEWAKERAGRMERRIDDQLGEISFRAIVRAAMQDGHVYGTGFIFGPLVQRCVRARYERVGNRWTSVQQTYYRPFVEHIPIWEAYPDMSATCLEMSRYFWRRRRMPHHKLAGLAKRDRVFDAEKIRSWMESNPNGSMKRQHFDDMIVQSGDRVVSPPSESGMYEVFERWGYLSGEQLRRAGVIVADDRLREDFFCNVWMLPNGDVIRAAIMPEGNSDWPIHVYYCDKDETSWFGEGIPAIMRDDQVMLNAATRMILDNAAISSGPQIEVAVGLLSGIEKVDEIIPWRVWPRNNTSPNSPALRVHEMPSRLNELMAIARMFDTNADEVTAIPRYMQGENVTSGAAGTAAGMSMLMAASNIVLKDMLVAVEGGMIEPFLRGMFKWNMKFSNDESIKGDFCVRVTASSSLVAKEIRARQVMEFQASTERNPQIAQSIKWHRVAQMIAEAVDLPDVVKDEAEIKAEQESDAEKAAAQLQQQLMTAQVARAVAEAELAKNRAQEVLANIELKINDAVSKRVETIFAAIQAGGAATRDPFTAPAADEVLKSAGFKDMSPQPGIDALNSPPVQDEPGTMRLMQRGQAFAEEPRGAQPAQPMAPATPDASPDLADPNTGQRRGIETPELDS